MKYYWIWILFQKVVKKKLFKLFKNLSSLTDDKKKEEDCSDVIDMKDSTNPKIPLTKLVQMKASFSLDLQMYSSKDGHKFASITLNIAWSFQTAKRGYPSITLFFQRKKVKTMFHLFVERLFEGSHSRP